MEPKPQKKALTSYKPQTQEWLRIIGGLVEWGTLPEQQDRMWVDILVATIDGHPNKALAEEAVAELQRVLGAEQAQEAAQ